MKKGTMSRCRTIVTFKQVGIGFAVVALVATATVLFNFLGTITCSTLIGMMLGSTRQWRWQYIPLSLVFPAIALIFLQISTTEPTFQRIGLVSLACFAAFWVTYLATFALMRLERQSARPPDVESLNHAEKREQTAPDATPACVAASNGRAVFDATLSELQGAWACDVAAPDARTYRKIIEVRRDQLILSTTDSSGQTHLVSRGEVEVAKWGAFKALRFFAVDANSSMALRHQLVPLWTWIYKVNGHTLTVALDFEESDRAPASETYTRIGSMARLTNDASRARGSFLPSRGSPF